MDITTEQKENCVIDLHITLPPERFQHEWQRIAEEYCRLARLPGFRKGKAPRSAVERRYAKEIQEEATEKLMQAAVREAIKEKKLELANYPRVKEVRLEDDQTLHVVATLVTKPEIELTNYRGIEIDVEKGLADDITLERHLEKLREDSADFVTEESRGLEMGDFAILDYVGTLDGISLQERYPELPTSFATGQHAWFRMEQEAPLPGFPEALQGLKTGESREVTITFPKTSTQELLREATVSYTVKLHEIKTRQLLPLDDAFAHKVKPGATLEALREEMRGYLQQNLDYHFHQKVRAALIEKLLQQHSFDPPEVMIESETAHLLKKIIQQNRERGIPEETMQSHQEELVATAKQRAEESVRLRFLLDQIAQKENIAITPEEFHQEIALLSQRYQMPVEKLIKELKKNNALGGIQEELLFSKTLQWLINHAVVKELLATSSTEDDGNDLGHVHGPHCHH